MIHHLVFWKLKPEAEGRSAAENQSEALRQLNALVGLVPSLVSLEAGADLNRGPVAWDLALYTTFASQEDLQAYQVHPEHQKVAAFIGSVVSDRAVVDFES